MILQVGKVDTPLEWGAVVVVAGAVLTLAAKYLTPLLKSSSNGGPKSIEVTMNGIMLSLNTLNGTLLLLHERLGNLPTKLDLLEGFQQSRHDVRSALAPVLLENQVRLDEILQEVRKNP